MRSDYGNDEQYTDMNTEGKKKDFQLIFKAIRRWRKLNEKWQEKVFFEDGLLLLSKEKMLTG